jgi:two-component system chemotaxis response regulator CheY
MMTIEQGRAVGTARVLVTEDSKTIRGFLCRHVRACLPAAELRECEHGAQAMALLAQGPADLVITDLQMPELGGEAFLLQGLAEGHLRSSAIIVISSAISPKVRESLAAFPRIRFLRKPATGDEISQAIRAVMVQA